MTQEAQGVTYQRNPQAMRGKYVAGNNNQVLFEEKDLELIDSIISDPTQLEWVIKLKPEATQGISTPRVWDTQSRGQYINSCKDIISATFAAISALRYTGILSDNVRDTVLGFVVEIRPDQLRSPKLNHFMQDEYRHEEIGFFGKKQHDRNVDGKLKTVYNLPIMTIDVKKGEAILNLERKLTNPADEEARRYIRGHANLTFIHTLGVKLEAKS